MTPQEEPRAPHRSAGLVLRGVGQLRGRPSGPRRPCKVRPTTTQTPAQRGHDTLHRDAHDVRTHAVRHTPALSTHVLTPAETPHCSCTSPSAW